MTKTREKKTMLKLNTSYSKKIPTEIDFSSKSFHASIEIELPDGLTENQLKEKIHNTFELVRNSVEDEIAGKTNGNAQTVPVQVEAKSNASNGNGQKKPVVPASQKQVKYLLDLGRSLGVSIGKLLEKQGVDNAYELSKEDCSALINELKGTKATA